MHGVGNAMLMRGGACAAELRLMGLVGGSLCVSGCVFVVWLCCVFCLLFVCGRLLLLCISCSKVVFVDVGFVS